MHFLLVILLFGFICWLGYKNMLFTAKLFVALCGIGFGVCTTLIVCFVIMYFLPMIGVSAEITLIIAGLEFLGSIIWMLFVLLSKCIDFINNNQEPKIKTKLIYKNHDVKIEPYIPEPSIYVIPKDKRNKFHNY